MHKTINTIEVCKEATIISGQKVSHFYKMHDSPNEPCQCVFCGLKYQTELFDMNMKN